MQITFDLFFNSRRQWVRVTIWEVARDFYAKFGDCIGIYWGNEDRKPKVGEFGQIHLLQSKLDDELASHELLHFLIDLVRTRNGQITPRNEEKIVSEYGQMVKQFWKKYNKILGEV